MTPGPHLHMVFFIMKIIKIGGGCLKDGPSANIILDLATARGKGNIFVVSAFYGITNILISGIEAALASEDFIEGVIRDLKTRHRTFVDCLVKPPEAKTGRFNNWINCSVNWNGTISASASPGKPHPGCGT